MLLLAPKPSLLGSYTGVRDLGLRFSFVFLKNGTYVYVVGQANDSWQLRHQGNFLLKYHKPASAFDRTPHSIYFEPTTFDPLPSDAHVNLVRSRDLPATKPVSYHVFWPTQPNDPYILFVPAVKSYAQRDSWCIRAVSPS